MFCIHCGKSNVENASFCAFCGKPISQTKAQPTETPSEWEYTFFRRYWERGKGGRWNLVFGVTEYSVRMDNWGQHQSTYLPEIQEFIDNGWQPISSPGPGSYRFRQDTDYAGSVKFTWLELSSFVVEFRRPARPRTEKEKQLLGVWQETHDPNSGFWNTLGNVVFSQKLAVGRWQYVFHKDRTFHRTDRDGKDRGGGIFFENNKGEIELFFKFSPDWDGVASVAGNKLVILEYKYPKHSKEYEQIS